MVKGFKERWLSPHLWRLPTHSKPDSEDPLSRIDDLLASLYGGQIFTKLDLAHAYQQVELEEQSRNKHSQGTF